MQLLLLGCTGFVGRELLPYLISQGHDLTIVSRKPSIKIRQKNINQKVNFLQINPADPESWENSSLLEALESAEGVVNLVGEPIAEKRWTKSHCKVITNSRLMTTNSLITAMKKTKHPPKVLINASAIGYYGSSQEDCFTEMSPHGKDFLSTLCKKWEELASQKPKQTRLLIIRIGIVLGSDGGALGKMLPIFRIGLGGPLGSGKQWMSWIHRTDLCQLIGLALSKSHIEGVINGVAPEPVSMSKFSKTLGESLGRPSLLAIPGIILKLLLGDGAKVVLEGQLVESKQLTKFNYNFKYPKLSEALLASI